MSRRSHSKTGAMLDLWRPPQGAGDPVGCLSSTYTFAPGLFDEQCLARFLEIESEPDREGLAFLLERESRLGSVYAGVLVDYTQAGVEHSLRWDVLPVRVRGGKQHAKRRARAAGGGAGAVEFAGPWRSRKMRERGALRCAANDASPCHGVP